jgi:lipopolysaccharide export system protein LptC
MSLGEVAVGSGRASRFAAAARHSRFVRRLRWLLPSLAIGVVAVFAGISTVGSWVQKVSIDMPMIEGTTLVMNNPRLTGFDSNRRPYELTAARARQDIRTPRQVSLDKVDARLELAANGWVRLTADRGFYDNETDRVRVEQNVHVTSSLGYEMLLEEAHVDIRSDTLVSDRPVEVRNGPNRIFGNRMRATERGMVVVFDDRVRVVFHPREDGEAQP